MRVDAERLLDLIDRIHAGATCDEARARSLEAMSDAFGGAAVLLARQAGTMVEDLAHVRWPAGSLELYTGRYIDPRYNETMRLVPVMPLGVPISARVAGEGVFESSEVYREAIRPFGLGRTTLGTLLARTHRDFSNLAMVGWPGGRDFDEDDEELLTRLIPALTSADRVRRLLIEAMEARQLLSNALDRVGRPVAVVDERLGLRYANAPARAVLEDGSALRLRCGRLSAPQPGAGARLRAVVRAAIARDAVAGILPLSGGSSPHVVRVEPLRPGEPGIDRPLALILGNRRSPVRQAELRALYGLTRREAEVAALFAQGLGVGEAAARLARSPNTVKTLARSVYGKLGVGGHAEAAARIRSDVDA